MTRVGQAHSWITVSVLPTELRISDVFTDEVGEWEVISRPYVASAGKIVHAKVRSRGPAATVKDHTWPAHQHVTARRKAPERPG